MGTQVLENAAPTTAALTRLPAVTIDGVEYPTYRDNQGREVMQDLDVARALELADRHKIRPLIRKHAAELGEVSARQAETPATGGRPGLAYYLTEDQALFIAAKCRTKAATAQLKRLIAVYMEARKGNGAAAVAIAQGAAEPRLSGGDSEDDKLIAVIETQLQLARANQRMKAELAQVAAQQAELARTQNAQAAKVDRLLAVQQAAEVEAQRPVTSQIPLLPVFNVAQHEALRVIRAHGFANGGRYQGSFNRVYDLYKSMYHEDLKVRAKNRGISPAELVTEMGIWDRLLAIAVKYLQPETERIHAERRMGGAYNA